MEEEKGKSKIAIGRPEKTNGDDVYTNIKIILSAIPIASELFSAIIVPPISKRRDAWMESIAEGVLELERKFDEFDITNLQNNDTFISLLMQATLVAIRNHQKEKLDALRNAVLNSALSKSPDEDLQFMFLNLIDSITPFHLRVLDLCSKFHDPNLFKREFESLPEDIKSAFPGLESLEPKRISFYNQIVRDLYEKGLVDFLPSVTIKDQLNLLGGRPPRIDWIGYIDTTELGKRFIESITSPIEKV